jgi:AraC family transcriptional regulator
MDETLLKNLMPPRFEQHRQLLVAGLGEHYGCESSAGIPGLWQRFIPLLGSVPGQIGRVAYGVCHNTDDEGGFDYLAGVEVTDFARLSGDWSRLRIPAHAYAVFVHDDHVGAIRRTWNTIWNSWLPQSGRQVADAPTFERYGANFDSHTGTGDVEIWIPLE